MRIDYSEPKQSYVAGTGKSKPRPRKEPVSTMTGIVVVIGITTFLIGFGTGWYFSQKSAKKSFQAATMQNSLENSPKPVNAPAPLPLPISPPTQPQANGQQQTAPASSPTQSLPSGQASPEPPLTFYKTLPGGEKNNILGSGINSKDEKVKQPLQAALPSNLAKPLQSPAVTKAPSDKTLPGDKGATKLNDAGGFTVQVASYSLKSEAETLKNKLFSKGYNVAIVESNQGDKGVWYRVRVGRRLDESAAKELSNKLGKGAMVIPDRD